MTSVFEMYLGMEKMDSAPTSYNELNRDRVFRFKHNADNSDQIYIAGRYFIVFNKKVRKFFVMRFENGKFFPPTYYNDEYKVYYPTNIHLGINLAGCEQHSMIDAYVGFIRNVREARYIHNAQQYILNKGCEK